MRTCTPYRLKPSGLQIIGSRTRQLASIPGHVDHYRPVCVLKGGCLLKILKGGGNFFVQAEKSFV